MPNAFWMAFPDRASPGGCRTPGLPPSILHPLPLEAAQPGAAVGVQEGGVAIEDGQPTADDFGYGGAP